MPVAVGVKIALWCGRNDAAALHKAEPVRHKLRQTVAANTDLQYLWAGSAPILRIMYRETNSSNYLRANILASTGAASFDIDLPETQSDIGVVLVCNGTDYAMHVAGGASASFVGSGPADFTNLFLGTPNAGAGTLVGHQRRFGLWRHVPSAAELAAIMKWGRDPS